MELVENQRPHDVNGDGLDNHFVTAKKGIAQCTHIDLASLLPCKRFHSSALDGRAMGSLNCVQDKHDGLKFMGNTRTRAYSSGVEMPKRPDKPA